MKTRIYFSMLATSVFLFASCSSNDNEEMSKDNGRKLRTLTIVQNPEPTTRSSITDQGSQGLSAMWEMGDEMTVYNKTYPSSGYHTIKATSTSKTANFVGTADCEVNDQLRLFYPSIGTEGTVTDPAGNGTLTLDISEQKGTLEDIQQHYDFFYGEATVEEVSDNAAVADAELSQNLAAICKFTFKCNKEYVKDISSVEVTNVASTATFTLSSRTAPALTPSAAGTINVVAANNIDNSVYVTLFPGETAPSFTVMAADGKYEGTLSAATLQAGKYYNVVVETTRTGGGIDDVNLSEDYVEVCGVKWARGNLQYDPVNGGDEGFVENWRIAPTQWHWIGFEDVDNTTIDIKDQTIIHDNFYWGVPSKPFCTTNYSSNQVASNEDITGTNKDLAFVKSNGKYRIPKKTELELLIYDASYQYGYILAEEGVRVYGMLFTEPGNERTTSLNTRQISLEELKRGLFLPAGGKLMDKKIIDESFTISNRTGTYASSLCATPWDRVDSFHYYMPYYLTFSPSGIISKWENEYKNNYYYKIRPVLCE